MKKIRTAGTILLVILSINLKAQDSSGQGNKAKIISSKDSVLLKKYQDGLQNTYLYSYEHQLYLDSLLTITPHRAYYWQQKGMPLCKQKKYEIGMMYLDSAVKYDESNHYLEYRAFMKCIFQKSYLASIRDFEAVKKVKGFSFVMDHSYDFYMGLCNLQLNKFERADSLIQNSIKWSETNSSGGHYLEYFYSGIIKMEEKQDSVAINLFDRALKIYPHFPDAKFYKSLCLYNLGHVEAAKLIIAEGLEDIKKGYVNNEDNALYEEYPYQKRKLSFEQMAESFDTKN